MISPRPCLVVLPFAILFLFLFISCGSSKQSTANNPSVSSSESSRDSVWADSILATMTLEEKVGQLIMARMYGHFISSESDEYERLVRLVTRQKVGGFVVFQGDVYETALLLNKLQQLSAVPLLAAADFERGAAMRIRRATYFPEAMAVGATRDPDYAYRIGKAIAEEARAIGIVQNLAPVADVNNNPANPVINTRSFGEDPHLVAEMVSSFVRGTNDGGVLSTAKHFPGHGDVGMDSHLDLPVLPFDRGRLDSVEFVSFKSAIASGVGAVMIAHLEVPALDSAAGVPATLSPRAVSGILKTELGFKGLVVTDAMEMRGILKGYSIGDAAVLALKAGVDIVLMPADETVAAEAIVQAVHSGALTEERINSSVSKLLMVKHRLGLSNRRYVDVEKIADIVESDAHQQLAREVGRKAITLLRNDGGIVPLHPSGKQKLAVLIIGDSEESRTDVNRPTSQFTNEPFGAYFVQQFRQRTGPVDIFRVSPASNTMDFDSILTEVKKYDLLVVGVYAKVRSSTGKADMPQSLNPFLQNLSLVSPPSVVISFGNPYVLRMFPQAESEVCAYADAEVMVESAVEALFGEIDVHGKLPVSIPGLAKFGVSLEIPQSALRRDLPAAAGFNGKRLAAIDSLMSAAIRDSVFPGAQLAIARDGILVCNKSFGTFTYQAGSPAVTNSTLFDLASLTKVIATTSAVMKLRDEGKLDLGDRVSKFIPEFAAGGKAAITIRQLLTHTSGLPAHREFYKICKSADAALDSVFATRLVAQPGDTTIYSDLGMIALGTVVERVSGSLLDEYVEREFFDLLQMGNTVFNPPASLRGRAAPTEVDTAWRKKMIQGTVHDENAWFLGGVSGHAGLFSTASDLAVFMQMIMNGGVYGGNRYLQDSTVKEFVGGQGEIGGRALGWDTKSVKGSSAGDLFSSQSFGHTGFTGTSIWADPVRNLFVVLLTNRVYPTRNNNKIHRFRPKLHDAVIRALMNDPSNTTPRTGR